MADVDLESELRAAVLAAGVGVDNSSMTSTTRASAQRSTPTNAEPTGHAQERLSNWYAGSAGWSSVGRPKAKRRRSAGRLTRRCCRSPTSSASCIATRLVGELEIHADEDGDVGYFEDGNDVLWHVFVDNGDVRYAIFER
jgi:hypothetical protein